MKSKLLITILIALSAVSAFAIDCDLMFVRNPYLPRDCVEMAWTTENAGAIACLYAKRGVDRPASPTAVQVGVYSVTDNNTLKFCGWGWMEVEQVNALHQPEMASL
jgi:hypothetical protein